MKGRAQDLISSSHNNSSELEFEVRGQAEAAACSVRGPAEGAVRIAGREHEELLSLLSDPSSSCLGDHSTAVMSLQLFTA